MTPAQMFFRSIVAEEVAHVNEQGILIGWGGHPVTGMFQQTENSPIYWRYT
jgi:hypothetical protein